MAQANAGPLIMPWGKGNPDEIIVFVIAGIVGAIVGATLIHYYRKAKG